MTPTQKPNRRAVIEWIDDEMAGVWRSKTPAEKNAIIDAMFRSARRMLASAVREQHPQWSPAEVDREVARRVAHGAG
jgi:hypothetical protein